MFMQDWLVRTCEIVDKYRPRIVYFDWRIQVEAVLNVGPKADGTLPEKISNY